jgi:hypothetical protein
MPLIPALGRWISEFEASLVYRVSFRTAEGYTEKPCLEKKKKIKVRAGEMAQRLKALTACSSRGPEFNSQQPHSGLQPSVMECNVLCWCV